MKTKSRNEIVKLAAAYLNKTSNHLFTTADGYLYKIETFEREGKLYYATIFLGNGKVIVYVKEAISERQFTWYGNNTLNVLQQELFPTYFKAKSIPYFKKMKEIVKDLMSELKINDADNKELIEKIKSRLPELERVN